MSEQPVPRDVQRRARRHRSHLGFDGIELDSTDLDRAEIARARRLLVVGVAPEAQVELEHWLAELRRRSDPRSEVRLLEESAPIGGTGITDRLRRGLERRSQERARRTRQVVEGARAAGWVVTSVERFETTDGRQWVDLVLRDVPAAVAAERSESGEGDGDERGE